MEQKQNFKNKLTVNKSKLCKNLSGNHGSCNVWKLQVISYFSITIHTVKHYFVHCTGNFSLMNRNFWLFHSSTSHRVHFLCLIYKDHPLSFPVKVSTRYIFYSPDHMHISWYWTCPVPPESSPFFRLTIPLTGSTPKWPPESLSCIA